MANPFTTMFQGKETTHNIQALNGAEVKLRTLSLADNAEIEAIIYSKGLDENGKPIISIEDINSAKILRVSKSLVNPKMSVKELNALSVGSMDAINEIMDIINPIEVDEKKS